MHQQWANLLFLHWKMNAEEIQRRLPKGLYVDTYDGHAWLGVVPFFMNRIRPSFLPPVPGISWFLELNVRTYVYDEKGTPGVWFFSLDCNQALAVVLAQQLFQLPYEHAKMQATEHDGQLEYHCRRDVMADRADYRYQPCQQGQLAVAPSLEFFLLERYLLFSANRKGKLFTGRVHHSPYRYEVAVCDAWSALPAEWNGFRLQGPPVSILTAETVNVNIFPLRQH